MKVLRVYVYFNEKMMEQKKNSYSMGIIIIGILFFIFGFVTWLNATLIPYLKIACELQHEWQGYLVTFAFYIAYFVMALPSSWVLRKTGYKNGMMLGLLVMAITRRPSIIPFLYPVFRSTQDEGSAMTK